MRTRIGIPTYLSARPLVFGLLQRRHPGVDLVQDCPAGLAEALERGSVDAALIPSIEFLRGVGRHLVVGPAQIARGRTGSLLLATDHRLEDVQRIAVDECCRTPLAVLRIVLDRLHRTLPDFCVFKGPGTTWRDNHDAVLLCGNRGVAHAASPEYECKHCYDLGQMWAALGSHPLVLLVWAYNDESRGRLIEEIVTESRDFGIRHLSVLAEEAAQSTGYDSRFLYDYFSTGWGFDLGEDEEAGLRVLHEYANEYQLIQRPDPDHVYTG